MQASEVLRAVECAGGELWVDGESLGYRLPESALSLVETLRASKAELLELLRQRPAMPPGIRLVRWEPVAAPVRLNDCLTVLDTDQFIRATVRQIEGRLAGNDWRAGHWSLPELMQRLEAVGVCIAIARETPNGLQ
jgi:hypothetical protein